MNGTLVRATGGLLAIILGFASATPLMAQQSSAPAQSSQSQTSQSQQTPLPPVELPENPGGSSSTPPAGSTQNPGSLPNAPQSQAPAPAQANGTAIAPPVQVSGGAASKPAGVAIAPPKQREIHSLLIKLGLIAGVGVAVGTVVGLSAASPGHVPNSPGH